MESDEEKLERLQMMIDDNYGTWDLSENDVVAIQYALYRIQILETAVDIAICRGLDIGKDRLLQFAEATVNYEDKP